MRRKRNNRDGRDGKIENDDGREIEKKRKENEGNNKIDEMGRKVRKRNGKIECEDQKREK